jgi:hypothetical protein
MPTLYRRLKPLSTLIFFLVTAGAPVFAYPVSVTINVTFSEISGQPDPIHLGMSGTTTGVITTTIESATATGTSATYQATVNVKVGTLINITNQAGTVTISTNGQIGAVFGSGNSSFNALAVTSLTPPTPAASSFGTGSFSAPASSTSYTIFGQSGVVGITGTISAVGLIATPLSGFSLTAAENGAAPTSPQISVGSNDTAHPNIAYAVTSAAPWLTLTNATGTTPGTVTATLTTALTPETYTGTVLVNTSGDTTGPIAIPITYVVTAAAPVITGLSPASATPGGAAFTLTVNGSGFISGDTVKWAGTALTTTFVNATQLTAAVPANLIVAPGSAAITVVSPASVVSNSSTFTISSAISGSRFAPLSPCRVVDTRTAAGPLGGPFVTGGGSRDFPIPSSSCGIPGTAQAYSLNLTVVPKGTLGYVTMWPTGQTQPGVSTLNSLDGRVKANAAIVPAGMGGAVSVFATDNTDVIIDINGYFVPASDSTAESFYAFAPCRLVDTRASGSATVSSGALIGGTSRTLPLLSSSCGVPGAPVAYSLNFTVIPANGTLGYLTVYPTGLTQPVVSTLNARTGTVVANAAIVPAGTSGSIDVFATDTTDLIVDIDGYFAAPGTGGLSFYPVSPCRVLDSRNPAGTPPFTGTINVNEIASGCASATAAQAYVFNATVAPPAPLGYLTLWPEGSAQPVVSTLNAIDGSVTSNMAIVPANGNAVSAFADGATYLILDTSGYFAP